MLFSLIIKDLNWEILAKNLVAFKKWEGVKDEKFQYYGGSLKNLIFRGGIKKVYRFMRRLGKKVGGSIFERGLIPQWTL